MQCNLFSVQQFAQADGQFCISGNSVVLYNTNHDIIAKCFLDQDLYTLGHSTLSVDTYETSPSHFHDPNINLIDRAQSSVTQV